MCKVNLRYCEVHKHTLTHTHVHTDRNIHIISESAAGDSLLKSGECFLNGVDKKLEFRYKTNCIHMYVCVCMR